MSYSSFCVFLCILIHGSADQDFNITPIKTSSGLYYEKIGDVLLSNNNWEFVTSVDYAGYLLFYQYLQAQAEKLHGFCQEYQSQACEDRYEVISTTMASIASTDEILAHFLGVESKRRVKRFWLEALTIVAPYILDPLGKGLSKSLFGENVDQRQLEEYAQQISHLRTNQDDIINQIQAQRTMFELDAEKKGTQIDSLKKMQESIQIELKVLNNTLSNNFEEHEKKIKDLIDMLGETQRKLKEQEEKQKHLTSDVENIKTDVKHIFQDLRDIGEDVTKNRNDINITRIETKLNSISNNFHYLLSRFESEQKTLLNVITNANRGFLDPYITTPLNLIEMLKGIQPLLPEDTRLPFHPNFENAKVLYNLIKPTILLHNNSILFILQLPLVHTKTFEIFKMTSFPMPVGSNKYVYVSPKKDYLLINDKHVHLLEYVLTSAADFREFCKDLGGSKYICDQIQQTNGPSTSLECEAQVFLNKKQLSDSCNTRIMKLGKPVFIKLQQFGAWIYLVAKPENLIVSCSDGSRKNVLLEGSGLLHISKDCTAQTSEFGLRFVAGSKAVKVSASYSPVVTLTDHIDMSKIDDFDGTAPESHKQVILPFDLAELDVVSVRIKDIGASHATTSYSVVIIVAVSIVAVTLLIIIFRKKICRKSPGRSFGNNRQDDHSTCQYSSSMNNRIEPKQFI